MQQKSLNVFKDDLQKFERQKVMLASNKDIERLELIYNNTPIVGEVNFYAARINTESIIFHNLDDTFKIKTFVVIGFLAIIISLMYILIMTVKKKSNLY